MRKKVREGRGGGEGDARAPIGPFHVKIHHGSPWRRVKLNQLASRERLLATVAVQSLCAENDVNHACHCMTCVELISLFSLYYTDGKSNSRKET